MPKNEPSSSPQTRHEPPGAAGPTLSSVDNALRLLEMVGERQALRVAEAADLLGVARSTAHRLLTALRQRDFVLQDRPNGAYRPGPALNAIGLAAISRIDIRQVARPVLEDLRDQTTETVTLGVLEGQNIRFIDSIESARSVRVGNRTGVVRQAHASAVGKAVLAALPQSDVDRRYPDAVIADVRPGAISEKARLVEELAEVRRLGYALNWEESSDGVAAVSVALRDASGAPVAGIGIAAPSGRMGDRDALRALVPALEQAALRIREQLGRPD